MSDSHAYRPDIDGLRAVAVLGVLLFHFKTAMFSGGFAGVDIFFVISGYLITRNIVTDAVAGRFAFGAFYMRRARRILPPLVVTVIVSFVFGLLWLPPEAMKSLGKESTHALLSIANIQYWSESKEYFAPASEQLALLHTWSLSLEEQFYLVWPLFLVFALRLNKARAAIVLAGAASLGLAATWAPRDPQAVFFLMPFRIFEFAIGAAIVFLEKNLSVGMVAANVLTISGMAAIVVCFTLLDSNSSFVLVTLLPCIGTAAIIFAGTKTLLSRGLMLRPVIGIGRISYSLYLCHWPIIFFAKIVLGDAAESTVASAILFIVMLGTAFLMQRYIEQPFRNSALPLRRSALRYAAMIAILVGCTHATFVSGGLTWRLTGEQRESARLMEYGWGSCTAAAGERCVFGQADAPLGLEILGDSFATQYIAPLDPLLKARHISGQANTSGGCPVLDGFVLPKSNWKSERCHEFSVIELERAQQNASLVIIGQNWISYRDEDGSFNTVQRTLKNTIEKLDRRGRRFLLIGAQVLMNHCAFDMVRVLPSPLPHAMPVECPPKSKADAAKDAAAINTMLADIQKMRPEQIMLLRPEDFYCDDHCPVVRNGGWLYRDDGHFTRSGAIYMGERSAGILTAFLDQNRD